RVPFRAPAAEVGVFVVAFLGADEEFAHLFVPVPPRFAAEVVHDLGGGIVVVHVLAIRRIRLEKAFDGTDHLRIGGAPVVHVLPAQKADRRHAVAAAGAGHIGIAIIVIAALLQEGLGTFDRNVGDDE